MARPEAHGDGGRESGAAGFCATSSKHNRRSTRCKLGLRWGDRRIGAVLDYHNSELLDRFDLTVGGVCTSRRGRAPEAEVLPTATGTTRSPTPTRTGARCLANPLRHRVDGQASSPRSCGWPGTATGAGPSPSDEFRGTHTASDAAGGPHRHRGARRSSATAGSLARRRRQCRPS